MPKWLSRKRSRKAGDSRARTYAARGDSPGADEPTLSERSADDAMDREADRVEESRRLWLWAILLALIGLTARAVFYARFPDEWYFRLGPDGGAYLDIATFFLRGGLADATAPLGADLREVFPPGYPLLISLIMQPFSDESIRAQSDSLLVTIRALQWLMAAAVVLMTFALSRRVLFGRSALIPPLLLTLSIAWMDIPSLIAYETLLAFLLLASVLLLVKAHERAAESNNARTYVWLAAAAFGYAVITQPRVLVILPFIAVWAWRTLPRSYFAVLIVVALLPVVLWTGRMYALYDQVVPLSINGPASVYLDNVDPIGGLGYVKQATPPECPRYLLFTDQRFEWASCMRNEGIAQIAEHPGKSLLAVPDRIAALLSPWNPTRARGTYASDHWDYHFVVPESAKQSPTFWTADKIANYLWIALYALLAVVGVAVLWVEGLRSSARLIAIPIVALPLVHLVFHAENRLRLPLTPFLMIAIALALVTLFDSMRGGRAKHL